MARLLTRDSLSGLMNRRAFDGQLGRLWQRAQRQASTMAVCMMDVDHFKRYNDAFGHRPAIRRSVASARSGRNRVVIKSNEDYGLMLTSRFEAIRLPA
jgi:diguanylate cyclase (GGDEF)-like protein